MKLIIIILIISISQFNSFILDKAVCKIEGENCKNTKSCCDNLICMMDDFINDKWSKKCFNQEQKKWLKKKGEICFPSLTKKYCLPNLLCTKSKNEEEIKLHIGFCKPIYRR